MPDVSTTLRAPNYVSAPGSPRLGQLYYNTTNNALYFWNGVSWSSTVVYQNASVATQGPGFATDTYLAGSAITIPTATSWAVGGQYRCVFQMSKTAAGVVAFQINIRIGVAGTTSDAAVRNYVSSAAQSAAVDQGKFEVLLNWRAVGASAVVATVVNLYRLVATAAGFIVVANPNVMDAGVVSSAFNSAASTKIGVSFNGGTSFSGTCQLVQAEYKQ